MEGTITDEVSDGLRADIVDVVEDSRGIAMRVVVDARNALDLAAWRDAGFTYRGLGRPGA